MRNRPGEQVPIAGEAAYFVHLHLTSARQIRPSHKDQHWIYEVEGKPRPMLVICEPKKERGELWFLALPITSSPAEESAPNRKNYQRIGDCLREGTDSFVELIVCKLPERLLHRQDDESPIMQPCRREEVQNAVKVLTNLALSRRVPFMG